MKHENRTTKLDETLSITECSDGFWLYDTTRGINLSMRAETPQQAYFESLKYYQDRLKTIESELKTLRAKVDTFIDEVTPEDENELPWD